MNGWGEWGGIGRRKRGRSPGLSGVLGSGWFSFEDRVCGGVNEWGGGAYAIEKKNKNNKKRRKDE